MAASTAKVNFDATVGSGRSCFERKERGAAYLIHR